MQCTQNHNKNTDMCLFVYIAKDSIIYIAS